MIPKVFLIEDNCSFYSYVAKGKITLLATTKEKYFDVTKQKLYYMTVDCSEHHLLDEQYYNNLTSGVGLSFCLSIHLLAGMAQIEVTGPKGVMSDL